MPRDGVSRKASVDAMVTGCYHLGMARSYGDILKRARENRSLTVRAFAGKVSMSPVMVTYVEHGSRSAPAEDKTLEIASVLQIDPTPLVAAAIRERGWPRAAEAIERLRLFAGYAGTGEEAPDGF
jgi:transcriptional regulator with XRE-family HTH domain